MKRCYTFIFALILVISLMGVVHADTFWIGSVYNDTIGTFVPNIMNFDWSSSGSGNAQGIGPAGTLPQQGTTFTLRYQSYLFALQNPNGNTVSFPGLNSSFEYTLVAQIPEVVQNETDLGGGFSTQVWQTLPGGVFYIYHDGSPNADVPSGSGFDDGVLVASGTIDPNQISTFTYITTTGNGIGSTILFGKVNYANPAYLNPALTVVGFRIEGTLNYPPLDSTTAAYFKSRVGEGNLTDYSVATNDLKLKVDTSSKFFENIQCCIDIEKQISIDGGLTWRNADNCVVPDTPTVLVPGSAEYKLIVTNCGNTTLTTVSINDPTLGIVNVPIADLAPGEQRILLASDISKLGLQLVCESAGKYPNEAIVNATCSDPEQTPVDASDTACLICEGCNVNIEKLVRKYQTNDPFVDADQCTDADVPVITIPGGAEYKLIVTNTGDSTLTNCRITDAQLGIDYFLGISLAKDQIVEFNGSVIPQLTVPDRCQASGELPNTASIACDCADIPGQKATDSDDACVKCGECCLEIVKTATPVDLTCIQGLWWLTNRCKCCKTFGCIDKCCTVPKVKYTYKIKNLCDPVKNVKVVDNKFGTITTIPYLGTGQEKIITKIKCVCNTTTNIATVKGYLVSDPVTFCTDSSDTITVTVTKPW